VTVDLSTMTDIDIQHTLDRLKRGDHALVLAVHARDGQMREKFTARGIVPGAEVGILKDGDPLLLRVDESRWALNRIEASTIEVDLIRRGHRPWWPFTCKT